MKKNTLCNEKASFLHKLAILLAPTDELVLSAAREEIRKRKHKKENE
ncbi:hypothetical protein [Kordiimonas aquimaris]|nr:hypothetical protein [Kordiimonas aquimaris]